MIFFDCITAPSPRRARIAIAEKGVEVETQYIDLRAGQHFGATFLDINPQATVPVLKTDDGTVLTENTAIAAYLEDIAPHPPLFGETPEERALVFEWNAIAEAQSGMALAEALRNSHPAMANRALPGRLDLAQIPELAVRGKLRFAAFKDMLNARFADRKWVAIDSFSFADITAFVFCDYARVIQMSVDDAHPHLNAFMQRMKSRPSAAL